MKRLAIAGLLIGAPACLMLALFSGSVAISPDRWWPILSGHGSPLENEIVWTLRASRALAAFTVGGLLALSGGLMQALLRNPLADPYLLGLSGGAAVGSLACMLWPLGTPPAVGATIGAALSATVVVSIAHRRLALDPYRLLLAGVAMASGTAAVVSLLLALAAPGQLRGMLFWLMGDLSASVASPLAALVLVAAGVVSVFLARGLDALALGPLKAASLGIAVQRTQWLALACAVIATACAVLIAGTLGFVGLVVPHLVRLSGHHLHRQLLPLSILAGGILLTLADTAARSMLAPAELPVGALLALLGVPVLLALVLRLR